MLLVKCCLLLGVCVALARAAIDSGDELFVEIRSRAQCHRCGFYRAPAIALECCEFASVLLER